MGLIRCPDCNREISDRAPACIHCGRPGDPAKPESAPAPAPRKLFVGHTALSVAGGVCLTVGLGCLVADRPGYALAALGVGLGLAAAGSLWSWCVRD